tara:strand:+ start:3455 stop:3751 length:297 start_codon:yes stop_codon:yes gene_type:complete
MGFKCYFCCERDRVGYWSNWCEDCANLRRMLLIYSPDKCCNILKRTLTRDEKQIEFKICQEVKKIVNKEIEETIDKTEDKTEDATYLIKPKTRSSTKK